MVLESKYYEGGKGSEEGREKEREEKNGKEEGREGRREQGTKERRRGKKGITVIRSYLSQIFVVINLSEN